MQQGAATDTTGYYDRSAKILRDYKDINWIKRARTARDADALRVAAGDRTASHKLGYAGLDGTNYAFPNIVQQNDTLHEFSDWRDALSYGMKQRSLVPVGDDAFADYFTRVGYKQRFPKRDYDEAMHDYVRDTKIVNNER